MIPPGWTTVGNLPLLGPWGRGETAFGRLEICGSLQRCKRPTILTSSTVLYKMRHTVSSCLPSYPVPPQPPGRERFSFRTSRCSVGLVRGRSMMRRRAHARGRANWAWRPAKTRPRSYRRCRRRRRQKASLVNCSRTQLVLNLSSAGTGSTLIWQP